MSDYTLILGDCLDKMSQIEDGSIDMILADLPYGERTACEWDKMIPFEPLWKQYKRIIKKRGVIVLTATQPFASLLVMSNLEWFKWEDIWEKSKPVGFLDANRRPLRSHENILVFCRSAPTYNPQKWQVDPRFIDRRKTFTVLADDTPVYGKRKAKPKKKDDGSRYPISIISVPSEWCKDMHNTQKPVALLAYLIRTYTNKRETVLDNVFGSCSTGEACLREGRHFIGIEKDEGYYQIGVDRLARVAAELRGEFVPRPAKKPVEDLPMFAGATL